VRRTSYGRSIELATALTGDLDPLTALERPSKRGAPARRGHEVSGIVGILRRPRRHTVSRDDACCAPMARASHGSGTNS
jgi:hypothetical protein